MCYFLLTVFIAIASLRIVSTYFVFSNTADEPAHIACGLEWLDRHAWTLEPLHPPLARVLTALGPFLMGERSHPELGMWSEGFRILGSGRHYDLNLAAARLGILPLFWIATAAVYLWARRLTSSRAALFAALIFTTTPPVLAHAGLATTDFALAAFSATSVVAALYFLEPPSTRSRAFSSLFLPAKRAFNTLEKQFRTGAMRSASRARSGQAEPPAPPLFSSQFAGRRPGGRAEASGLVARSAMDNFVGNTALRAALLGFSIGLAIASKFSALVFLPAILSALLIWLCLPNLRRPEFAPLRTAAFWFPMTAFVAFATIWSIYRFSFSKDPALGFRVPFPELFAGLRQLRAKNAFGSPAYLCGRCSLSGFWYYFLAVLSVKTPLGMVSLLALGIWLGVKRDLRALLCPLLVVAAVLITAAFSRIDLGVRHVLAVYPALSVAAGIALERALHTVARRGAAVLAAVFLLWHLGSGAIAHPDYLAYTNELALPTPENVLVDSDLDWGQDMKRLAVRARQLGIQEMATETMGGSYVLAGNAFPKPLPFDWRRPTPGWNAVSVTPWKLRCFYTKGYQRPTDLWPDKVQPVEKIGKSTYLFYVR